MDLQDFNSKTYRIYKQRLQNSNLIDLVTMKYYCDLTHGRPVMARGVGRPSRFRKDECTSQSKPCFSETKTCVA